MMDSDEDKAYADYEALEIGYQPGDYPEHVTQDLILPTAGNYGSQISWHSYSEQYVAGDGTVTRPGFTEGDYWVYLEASVTCGDAVYSKGFYVLVKRSDTVITDEDKALADYEALEITYAPGENNENVTQDIILLTAGNYGSAISWDSYNESIISNEGVVTRPSYSDGDAWITLYATITYGEYSYGKYFDLCVKRDPAIISDADKAYADYEGLAVGYASGDSVYSITQDLTLPDAGAHGSTITWYSYNQTYISNSGAVTRPPYSYGGDVYVTLRAYIVYGTYGYYKYFYYNTVKRNVVVSDEDKTLADYENLQIGYASGDYSGRITQNLTLPTAGTNGSSIAWASTNETYVSTGGIVVRPPFSAGEQYVTLSATITNGTSTRTKNFNLTLPRLAMTDSDADLARADVEALQIGYAPGDNSGNVNQNLTLPTSGVNGSTITWASSDEATITPDGIVTRPSYTVGQKTVILTVTVTKGEASETKIFYLTVKVDPNDDHGYNLATATEIAVGAEVDGGIDYPGDWDYFKFTAGLSGNYSMRSISNIDTYGYLYDENGSLLAYNDD